jgi:hypothetical protein
MSGPVESGHARSSPVSLVQSGLGQSRRVRSGPGRISLVPSSQVLSCPGPVKSRWSRPVPAYRVMSNRVLSGRVKSYRVGRVKSRRVASCRVRAGLVGPVQSRRVPSSRVESSHVALV